MLIALATAGGHNILVKCKMLPAQKSRIWCSLFQVVLSPIWLCFQFITLFFCRQGRRHMPCLLPHGRFCEIETNPRKSLPLDFPFVFFNQCRNIFLPPAFSPSEHRGSLNAVCVQPHTVYHQSFCVLRVEICPSLTFHHLTSSRAPLIKWNWHQICFWNERNSKTFCIELDESSWKNLLNVHMLKSYWLHVKFKRFSSEVLSNFCHIWAVVSRKSGKTFLRQSGLLYKYLIIWTQVLLARVYIKSSEMGQYLNGSVWESQRR